MIPPTWLREAPRLDLLIVDDDDVPVIEFVPVERSADAPTGGLLPEPWRSRVLLNVIHDGDVIPRSLLTDRFGDPIDIEEIRPHYVRERDWGASAVAEQLASNLGLDGFYRIRIARVLMDFGRFPGETRGAPGHLNRFAINHPFCRKLGWTQKRAVLEQLYDTCSETLEAAIDGQALMLGLHTYDTHNASGTERPDVSVITQPQSYQLDSAMPEGLYDELYPDVLAEFTADRILRDRIALTLERAGVRVAHNYPYLLPEGSLEIRSQVFFFFAWLREQFEAEYPETKDLPAFDSAWQLLLDTNLRSVESAALRGYMHMFRHAPTGRKRLFRDAVEAYAAIASFTQRDDSAVVRRYRMRRDRPSSMALEVRKDLVWKFEDGAPVGPRPESIGHIAGGLAQALVTYFGEDKAHLAAAAAAG